MPGRDPTTLSAENVMILQHDYPRGEWGEFL